MSSTAAGGISAGIIAALTYGTKGAIRASLASAIVAGSCQGLLNAGRNARLDYLLQREECSRMQRYSNSKAKNDSTDNKFPVFWSSIRSQAQSLFEDAKWLPIRPLTDEEYLKSLQQQLDANNEAIQQTESTLKGLQHKLKDFKSRV
jgi:hypothetical protein